MWCHWKFKEKKNSNWNKHHPLTQIDWQLTKVPKLYFWNCFIFIFMFFNKTFCLSFFNLTILRFWNEFVIFQRYNAAFIKSSCFYWSLIFFFKIIPELSTILKIEMQNWPTYIFIIFLFILWWFWKNEHYHHENGWHHQLCFCLIRNI